MVKSSAFAMQLAHRGVARVLDGETPELKNSRNLSQLHGEQNLDFFESSMKELQARDNQDGDVSIHVFSSGPDQDPAPGKLQVGDLKAEFQGDTNKGTRFSTEAFGDIQKFKAHRFDESEVVVFEATVKPGNEITTSVLVLDRENPENSIIGKATSNWILS